VVITPESSNEFPWTSIWRLVKPHANYCVNILKARWLRPAFAESYRLLRVTLSKELVAFHVSNAPDQWHKSDCYWVLAQICTAAMLSKSEKILMSLNSKWKSLCQLTTAELSPTRQGNSKKWQKRVWVWCLRLGQFLVYATTRSLIF